MIRTRIVLAVAFLMGAAWLATGLAALHSGNAAHGAGDHDAALARYGIADRSLLPERWVLPFNRGVVHHELGDHHKAAAEFAAAAAAAPERHQCMVRLNWSAALESAAGAAASSGDSSSAAALSANAMAVLADASCADDAADQWRRARERLESRRDGSPTPTPPPSQREPTAEEEIHDRQVQAQQEYRRASEDRETRVPAPGGRTW